MTDKFESYLEQLKAMEQADNRAALNSFCALNKADLSFFKGVWEPLQTLLNSKNNFAPSIISQIKQILPKLASIKSKYLQLQRDAKPHCKEKINSFQSRIDSLNINNIEVVESELSTLAFKNLEEVKPIISSSLETTILPKKEKKAKTLSFRFLRLEDKMNVSVIYNGIELGTPPCQIEVNSSSKSRDRDIVEIICWEKKTKTIWKLFPGSAGVLFLSKKRFVFLDKSYPINLGRKVGKSRDFTSLVPDMCKYIE